MIGISLLKLREIHAQGRTIHFDAMIRDLTREAIAEAISLTGTVSGAARLLGMKRPTLVSRMQALGMETKAAKLGGQDNA